MNTLHIRNVPANLYQRLQRLAKARNHSLSAQVITMLAQVIEDEERQQKQEMVLASIRRRRFTPPAKSPSRGELLREDRDR